MADEENLPVILIAIADYRTNQELHLRQLGNELDGIVEALGQAEEQKLCKVVTIADATVDKIVDAFIKHPVCIFHYAGHADGYKLLLEESLYADGLGSLLADQSSLKLVFLNACSTQPQVRELHSKGVPVVIATSRSIQDRIARDLAIQFYSALGLGKTIELAFQQYTQRHEMKHSDLRGLYWKKTPDAFINDWPWAVSVRPGSEVIKSWSLANEAENPLFGLPPIPKKFDLPETPFRYLRWFERKHAEVFFGREQEIHKLYALLTDPLNPPITLMYGQSGVGKSSLLHAGLFPRLEADYQVHYLRRDPGLGLNGTLQKVLNIPQALESWKEAEKSSEQAMIIILDQAEEVFTRPMESRNSQDELTDFLNTMVAVFEDRDQRPQGKLLLAYRKEYHAEINEAFRQAELVRSREFIEPLKAKGLITAVNGLTQNEHTRKYYKLTIEQGLPQRISQELSADPDSPLAPMLQILLTRLWEVAIRENEDQPTFSIELYEKLKEEGLLLSHFLQRQLQSLETWQPQWAESGLVLDVLYQFTTITGTSAQHITQDIEEMYHNNPLFSDLLFKLQDTYLLVLAGNQRYSLAHDTLAPLVRQRYELSDRPGQRADRLLRSKLALGESAGLLSREELKIVESGKEGRKAFSEPEKTLIAQSRSYWADAERKDLARSKVLDAIRLAEKNPTESFNLASEAWSLDPSPDALEALHLAFYEQHFDYQGQTFATPNYHELGQHESYVDYVAFSPDGQSIVSASKDENIRIWSLEGEELQTFAPGQGRIYSAQFSPDGRFLVTATSELFVSVWDLQAGFQEAYRLEGHTNKVKYAEFSPDGQRIVSASWDGTAKVWTSSGKLLQALDDSGEFLNFACFTGTSSVILTAGNDSRVRVYKAQSETGQYELNSLVGVQHDDFVISCRGRLVGEGASSQLEILSASWDRTARFEVYSGFAYQEDAQILNNHTDRVHGSAISPDGTTLVTTSWDTSIRLWNREGKETLVLQGHKEGIFCANFSPDGRYLVSASSDKRILLWDLMSRPIRTSQGAPAPKYRNQHTTQTLPKVHKDFPDGNGYAVYVEREVFIFGENGKKENTLPAPTGGGLMPYLDISPDGSYILVPDGMRNCKVFTREGKQVANIFEPGGVMVSARFVRGGDCIETSNGDGLLLTWPFTLAAMIDR